MDWTQYSDQHIHPVDSGAVYVVGYKRHDSGWDVYVCEPAGSCPEIEAGRVDQDYVFVTRIESPEDIDRVADAVDQQLGDSYKCELYFRESGGRRVIGKIQSHLHEHGAQHVWVRSTEAGDWELVIRRKDFELAREIADPNA